MDSEDRGGAFSWKAFNRKRSLGRAFCERYRGIVRLDRAKDWAAIFPFPIKDILRTFFEIEGAAEMEEECLPCLCYVLKNLYHLGARENPVVRETERGIIDEGIHKATVM